MSFNEYKAVGKKQKLIQLQEMMDLEITTSFTSTSGKKTPRRSFGMELDPAPGLPWMSSMQMRSVIASSGPWTQLIFGSQSGDIDRIGDILPNIVSGATEVYTDIPAFETGRTSLHKYLYGPSSASEKLKKLVDFRKVKPLRSILNEMRAFKSEDEVLQLRRVGQAAGRAFTESMRQTFTKEKDLTSFLEYQFKVKGCDTSAFVPVVAGGSVRHSTPSRLYLN